MRRQRVTVLLILLVSLLPGAAHLEDLSSDELVRELSQVYESWRQACLRARLDEFLRVRDPEEIARVEKKIGRRLTPEDISAYAERIRPIGELRFLGISRDGSWAQVQYHGGDAEPDAAGPRVRFHILLFHLHDDGWKLAVAGSVTNRKFTETGKPVTIEMIEIPDRMRLPSERKDAT